MQHLAFLPVHASEVPKEVKSPRTPLNPLLAALFHPPQLSPRSRDLANALKSPRNYVILVPTTTSLLYTVDQETNTPFAELCNQEDFLASHIVKIGVSAKAIGRARVFWTLNGRSIVIKDDFIYTNKGFKTVAQARLLTDRVYTTTSESLPYDSQYLIYYITKPLIGNASPLYDFKALAAPVPSAATKPANSAKKITTFGQLLSHFPLIARQIQEPLNTIFENFDCSEATEPDLVTMIEDVMERGIALFQSIDHSVVNAMASSTGLTGPEIEKMLENYVGKHLHAKIWPRLTVLRALKDSIIRAAVKNMKNISLGQLGVQPFWVDGGDSIERMVMSAVVDLENISKGENAASQVDELVKILRNLGVVPPSQPDVPTSNGDNSSSSKESKEKLAVQSNVSADVLVSLMIVVVTWSKLDHLDSLLFYMRNFSFLDVDTGEVGYALSTFEAVIFHIMNNSSKLAIVSSANAVFWKNIRSGKTIKPAFETPGEYFDAGGIDVSEIESLEQVYRSRNSSGESAIMMAVQASPVNLENLEYLLSKREIFPIEAILRDQNQFQTTLFSAAVQSGNKGVIDAIWKVLADNYSTEEIKRYLARKDEWQRSAGHYLFNFPELISSIGGLISWTGKDQNGQTPLFALCRSYDHAEYTALVRMGIDAATKYQPGSGGLRFLDHVDNKGNTLLHIMKDIPSLEYLLDICDIDVNRVNDKGLTPLMVNSKFSRIAAIETLTKREEVDISRRNFRGLNAAELAKDETTRSRIEDITLFSKCPLPNGRITSVLRGFFADDNVHFIVKSGIPPGVSTITSVKRTFADFTFMARWMAYELPASWIPVLNIPHNPFAIPSRPSRSVVREVQFKLDYFLRTLLLHPTFSTHELLWEFFLVAELTKDLSEKRSKQKAESRRDTLEDEYPPVENTDEVVIFFNHALKEMRRLDESFLRVVTCGTAMYQKRLDLAEAYSAIEGYFKSLTFLPISFVDALTELTALYQVSDSHQEVMVQELHGAYSAVKSLVTALARPNSLVEDLMNKTNQLNKYKTSLHRASTRLPLGLLDDTRSRYAQDATHNIQATKDEIALLGSEIRYSQTIMASELGGFNDMHEKEGLRIIGEYVREKLKWEKVRLKGMKSVLEKIKA
ncbi:hypothetical protein BZA70DRAFT_290447 [Myxozyma melibiosi]|uniref:VPS9 domain-containing protein n=1 Tax=Myxozyma melibiosi TaxID=54550 RepID=A0ABR1F3U6_9ASCO